jgi:hypothetical protein
MKNLVYYFLGTVLGILVCVQSFAENAGKNNEPSSSTSATDRSKSPPPSQEGANAATEMSNSGQPNKKGATARNVKGRDGKVPTESSKNAKPSQQKTQERTESVE